jgi:hypothetical protein
VKEDSVKENTTNAVMLLTNHARNSKEAFRKLQAREKLTESDKNTIVSFYLETLAQLERIAAE